MRNISIDVPKNWICHNNLRIVEHKELKDESLLSELGQLEFSAESKHYYISAGWFWNKRNTSKNLIAEVFAGVDYEYPLYHKKFLDSKHIKCWINKKIQKISYLEGQLASLKLKKIPINLPKTDLYINFLYNINIQQYNTNTITKHLFRICGLTYINNQYHIVCKWNIKKRSFICCILDKYRNESIRRKFGDTINASKWIRSKLIVKK